MIILSIEEIFYKFIVVLRLIIIISIREFFFNLKIEENFFNLMISIDKIRKLYLMVIGN